MTPAYRLASAVIPAQAGIHLSTAPRAEEWVPVFRRDDVF